MKEVHCGLCCSDAVEEYCEDVFCRCGDEDPVPKAEAVNSVDDVMLWHLFNSICGLGTRQPSHPVVQRANAVQFSPAKHQHDRSKLQSQFNIILFSSERSD
jgi:hypothetical protein